MTVLTALALLLASGTAAAGEHRCGGSSMPSTACCCDHGSDADEAKQRGPAVQGICCELRAPADRTAPVPPAALDGQAPEVLAPPVPGVVRAQTPELAAVVTIDGSPPPVRGPPLFVRHRRFLI